MKNGYYLSAYVHIDTLAYLEKIQIRHDQNIALWTIKDEEIELVHYWELERLTGAKRHNRSFCDCAHFEQVLNQLLSEYDITKDDLIEIWGIPQYAFHEVPLGKVEGFSYHATAHAYSVLLSNMNIFRNNNILVLAVDGGPDNLFDKEEDAAFCACYTCQGGLIEWVPIASPAPLWSYAKNTFHLEEGSLMALMSACNCSWNDFSIPFLEISCLQSAYDAVKCLDNIKQTIFDVQFDEDAERKFNFDSRFTETENRISMFMKIICHISNNMMCNNLNMLINRLNINPSDTYLAVVGGYALNCPSNSYLLKKYQFKEFYEVPCVNDAGISLGYGLGEFFARKPDMEFEFKSAFYGNKIVYDEKMKDVAAEYIESACEASADLFVKDISKEVVIWIEGRSEIGPRALGHRSILADARNEKVKDTLNKIKERQWWRPVAPIILQDYVAEWFEEGTASDYMLKTFIATDKAEERTKAVLHLDKSARVQTINIKQGFLYECIKTFYEMERVPVICNTSLNDKGEPIIDTFYGALSFAIKKGIHIIYINGIRIVLNENKQKVSSGMERTVDFERYARQLPQSELLKKLNPYNISRKALKIYYDNIRLYGKIDLTDKKNAKFLERLVKLQTIYQMKEI